MNPAISSEISQIDSFLKASGLTLVEGFASGGMGNQLLRYENDRIQVRLVCDRGNWFIEVHDPLDHPESWTGMSLFRSLLTGAEDHTELPLSEQAEILESNWTAILDRLGPEKAKETHKQLDVIYRRRLKRLLPKLDL